MPIVVSPEAYVGRLLYLSPGYGWGWHGIDDETSMDYAPISAAGGCQMHVCRFISWGGEVRGIVGKVEQPGHLFDGLWVVCATMLQGEWDFTDRLCWRYDLELGTAEPDNAEWPRLSHGRCYGGYGILAESSERVSRWWQSQEQRHV